jgi:hypothetical protein
MPRIPILSNESNTPTCLPDSLLPTFYMEDYTVLGLRVGNLGAAERLLGKNGIVLHKKKGYLELSVEKRDQLAHIIRMLNSHHIPCEIADIVEHVYQG